MKCDARVAFAVLKLALTSPSAGKRQCGSVCTIDSEKIQSLRRRLVTSFQFCHRLLEQQHPPVDAPEVVDVHRNRPGVAEPHSDHVADRGVTEHVHHSADAALADRLALFDLIMSIFWIT